MLHRVGLQRVGLQRVGLQRVGLQWVGLPRVGLRWVGLRRVGLRRVAVAAMALAIAASAVLGGRAYVWCAPMAEARAHCCCPHTAGDHDAIRVDCCDDRVTPTLPATERASAGSVAVAPAPLAAVLALDLLFARDMPAESWRERAIRAARAGPRERVHARASVYLI